MKTRKNLLILVILIATLTLGVLPVSAQAERYEFEAIQKFNSIDLSETKIWDSGGIHHVRNQKVVFAISGDVNGFNYLSTNSNTEIATGNGVMWGDIILELEWNGLQGTFEGKSQNAVEGGKVYNINRTHFVGQGTGDFEGMTMFAEYGQNESNINVLRGTILVHGGE